MENEHEVDSTIIESDEVVIAEESEETTEDGTEDVVTLTREEHEVLLKKANAVPNILARAKKAEEKAKEVRRPEVQSSPSSPDIDERILKANGMPDELLKDLKAIAQVRGNTLLDAVKDPLFVTLKESYEKEQKVKSASLGASRGSGEAKPKKDATTPGLSREEHKEIYLKSIQ
jgi:hypothetical protein